MSELPHGWTRIKVDELAASEPAALTDGPFGSNLKTSHYTDEGPRVIRLQNIGEGEFIDEMAHISEEHFDRLSKHEAIAGDVVIAMLGASLPRACIVPAHVGPAIVKADCVRLRVHRSLTTSQYALYALNSPQMREQASELVHGVGRPRLGLKWLKTLTMPVAPLSEQHRIVEALDSHLSRLDEATATLERVQRNLERYRASVLQAAVEGRLVPTEAELARSEGRDYEPASVLLERILAERRRRWEEAEAAKMKAQGKTPKNDKWKAKYKEPEEPDTSELPELPEGWCWATTDQLFWFVTSGSRGWAKYYSDTGAAFLRIGNLSHDSISIDLSNLQRVEPPESAETIRTRVISGDILVSITADVGMVALVKDEVDEAYINQHVSLARPVSCLHHPYLAWFLSSPAGGQRQFQELQRGATKAGLGLADIRSVNVPLPPLREQHRITDELERRHSTSWNSTGFILKNQSRITRLRQSILKWAFEGKLVDQDPTDEPASALLDRIRAEREAAAATSKPKRRRKKTATP